MTPSVVLPDSDQELLRVLRDGEPQAVSLVYQRYGSKMLAFARRYVADDAAAEDVVIDLLHRWLERPPSIADADRVSAFLATSIYHAAIDWIRRDRAEQGRPPRIARAALDRLFRAAVSRMPRPARVDLWVRDAAGGQITGFTLGAPCRQSCYVGAEQGDRDESTAVV